MEVQTLGWGSIGGLVEGQSQTITIMASHLLSPEDISSVFYRGEEVGCSVVTLMLIYLAVECFGTCCLWSSL